MHINNKSLIELKIALMHINNIAKPALYISPSILESMSEPHV